MNTHCILVSKYDLEMIDSGLRLLRTKVDQHIRSPKRREEMLIDIDKLKQQIQYELRHNND